MNISAAFEGAPNVEFIAKKAFILLCLYGSASRLQALPMSVAEESGSALSASGKPVILGVYDSEADADMTVITARLSEKPSFTDLKLEDHGAFFQIVLPNVIVPHPGQFNSAKGPYAKKLAAYQISATDGALRIFTEGDSKVLAAATTAEILNDRVVVTIDHRLLPSKDPTAALLDQSSTTAEGLTSGDLTPADLARTSSATGLGIGANVVDLSSRLNSVAVFSAIMLLGLLALYFSKGFLRRRRGGAENGETFQMKILSSMMMAPKQRLALIEICNERILVGVSPGQLSYLTTLNSNAKRQPAFGLSEPSVGLPPQLQQYFQRQSPAATPTVDLKPAPITMLEDDVDPKLASRKISRQNPAIEPQRNLARETPARRINVAISDDGIESRLEPQTRRPKNETRVDDGGDIGDVTRIIREKLKNLSHVTPKT